MLYAVALCIALTSAMALISKRRPSPRLPVPPSSATAAATTNVTAAEAEAARDQQW